MSTRSRRSAGGDGSASLNPAMIQLFDTARLKKELQSRGLPTTGQKQALADRLYDAVVGGDPLGGAPVTPSPKTTSRRKPAKVKQEPVDEDVPAALEQAVEEKPSPEKIKEEAPTPVPAKKIAPKRGRTTKVKKETVDPDYEEAETTGGTPSKKPRKRRDTTSPTPQEGSPAKRQGARATVKKEPPEEVEKIASPSSSKKPVTEKDDESDDDVPLLSILGAVAKKVTKPIKVVSTKIKQEVAEVEEEVEEEEEVPSTSDQPPPTHQHGTRRSTAVKREQQKQKEKVDLLQNSKLLGSDDCEMPAAEPSISRKDSTSKSTETLAEVPPKPIVAKEPRKSGSGASVAKSSKQVIIKAEEKPKPVRKPISLAWQEKVEAMKKGKEVVEPAAPGAKRQQEAAAAAAAQPQQKAAPVKPASRPSTSKVAPQPASGGFVLDDILTQQEKEANEAKRKRELEEQQQKLAEQRIREKMAEQRRKAAAAAAEAAARLAAQQSSSSSSSVNSPSAAPTPPTKKPHPYSIPQITHPYGFPQPLAHSKTTPPLTKSTPPTPQQVGAAPAIARATTSRPCVPPPPPKKPGSGASSAINSPASLHSPGVLPTKPQTTRPSIPPPPPKPKDLANRPVPRVVPSDSESKASPAVNVKKEVEVAEVRIKEEVDERIHMVDEPNLVDSVFSALVSVIAQNQHDEEASEMMETDDMPGPSGLNEEQEMSEKELVQKLKEELIEEEEYEEYDPLGTSVVDVSHYVPSAIGTRNQTMVEGEELMEEEEDLEEDEYVPSDYDDVADSEESEGESGETTMDGVDAKKENKPRKSAGKDEGKTSDAFDKLLRNPHDLLQKASAVLQSLSKIEADEGPQIVQVSCDDDYEPEEQDQKTPEYHGEPVPSDEEDIFDLAAGISKPKKKKEVVIEEEKLPSDEKMEPDFYNADLHIKGAVDKNWQIEPENADGLALMWGGVRSNYGIRLPFRDVRNCDDDGDSGEKMEASSSEKPTTKKIVFQIKITEFLPTKHLPFEEMDPHDIRIGFSLRSAPNILGESPNSYCITSLGKKAHNIVFTDFGPAFHQNDVITACIDLEEATISYWKNAEFMGVAFTNVELPDGDAVYPHICIKNCNVAVNFGDFPGEDEENKWPRNEDWRFLTSLGRGDLERSPKSPDSKAACTVIMMVGLPGVGKTTWVREYLRDHPDEHWTVINTEGIMAAMKVNGVSRRRAHQGRWDMVMGLVGKSLQRSVLLAARRRRNYILDMTNTSRDARKKRLQLFEEFRRKCVIIMPSDEDILDRQARQARLEGTAIMPPEAMLEMKAMISLPSQEFEPFEDIYFIEPSINRVQEAIDQIARYNEEARPWFQKKYRRRRSQMIGLGEGMQRDTMQPKKFTQPLTVMPQLKVAVIPLDDPSNTGPLSSSSVPDSGPLSASLGFGMVQQDNHSPIQVPRIDLTQPPPTVSTPTSMKPLVRVTIEDIPASSIPGPFNQANGAAALPPAQPQQQASLEEEMGELDEEEMRELRESTKASSSNPMIAEAVMRAKLKAMLVKKKEKRAEAVKIAEKPPVVVCSVPSVSSTPPLVVTTVPPPAVVAPAPSTPTTVTAASPIPMLGTRNIPTIGAVNPITIDTTPSSSRHSSNPNSPRLPIASPAQRQPYVPPPTLTAPYLSSSVMPQAPYQYPGNPMMQQQQQMQPQYNIQLPPIGAFSLSRPPPVIMPSSTLTPTTNAYPYQQWPHQQ